MKFVFGEVGAKEKQERDIEFIMAFHKKPIVKRHNGKFCSEWHTHTHTQ